MSEEPRGFRQLPEDDRDAFYELANRFLEPANDLVGIEPVTEIAAAFLYACARYNAFAMQAQSADPRDAGDDDAAMLADALAKELRNHMGQRLQTEPDAPPSGSDAAVVASLLAGLDDRDDDDLDAFLDMADRFIDVANGVRPPQKVSRLSACFMHAAARFNVYAMQRQGLKPGHVDDALAGRLCDAYRRLVGLHLSENLIKPND